MAGLKHIIRMDFTTIVVDLLTCFVDGVVGDPASALVLLPSHEKMTLAQHLENLPSLQQRQPWPGQ